ncbi:MAG: DUF4105 domain-containing protein [Candidatus Marithrix sp.]|nr:DUF4105 domain-containing protein [Candidatus Marithrix sp.]
MIAFSIGMPLKIITILLYISFLNAQASEISNHPTWLKLLHYNHTYSTVLTDSFFLSSNGKYDPEAELVATIKAYSAPWNQNPNEHARCKFPARYFWLSTQLDLPNYKLIEPRCKKLKTWGLFDSVKSISLLLVSGYLGNPASTFGHSLLKLNTESDNKQLFDLTINYGALIPEDESTFLYVMRGLWGGYKAGFSDKYFYTQDIVYSRTELRDIWDYKLKLSDYERIFLILHIWEIVGNKFDYYFLDENCAYRLAELLNLVIDEELLVKVLLWYVPVELFHRLDHIDKSNNKQLIESVKFIPSNQRQLYHKLKLLTPEELTAFNTIIRNGNYIDDLKQFSTDKKILILSSLLAYYQYKFTDDQQTQRELKRQILLARLQLPARSIASVEIPELPSPADGSLPMEFGLNFVNSTSNFLRLNWSPFKKDLIGSNSLEGDELVILDLKIDIDKDKLFLNTVDLIRVMNLNTLPVKIEKENQLSWKLRFGIDRVANKYDGVASFGTGYAWQWKKNIISYGMVDFTAHTLSPIIRLYPNFGLRFDLGKTKTWLYIGTESGTNDTKWGGKMQYQFNKQYAFYATFDEYTSVGLKWYW